MFFTLKKNTMLANTNPQAFQKRLDLLKPTINYSMSNGLKKLKEEMLPGKSELISTSLPVSGIVAFFLKFYKGLSGMMPLKSVGPFF